MCYISTHKWQQNKFVLKNSVMSKFPITTQCELSCPSSMTLAAFSIYLDLADHLFQTQQTRPICMCSTNMTGFCTICKSWSNDWHCSLTCHRLQSKEKFEDVPLLSVCSPLIANSRLQNPFTVLRVVSELPQGVRWGYPWYHLIYRWGSISLLWMHEQSEYLFTEQWMSP